MLGNQEKNLLRIIKLSPVFIILVLSILIITILINEQNNEIKVQKKNIEKNFIQDEKERIKLNITSLYTSAKLLKATSEDELKKDLKSKINNIYNLMMNIYINNKDKKSKDEIILQMKEAVDTIRYDNGKGYFSIHTLEGINILQPIKRSYEGTSVLNRKDAKGTYTVQKAIEIAKTKGEGIFNWYSLKPNGGLKEFEKVGIVKKFEPYNLIITTGVFKEDFQSSLKEKVLTYISKLKYKNDGYVFVIEFDGNVLYHPSKKAINGNIFEEKRFTHINSIYKDLILKKGGDRADYLLIKPKVVEGRDTKDIKITYAKKIDDWKWLIATNFKLSDANIYIENMKTVQEKKYDKYKNDIIFYGLIFTVFFLIVSYFISKLIENEFLKYKTKIEEEKENLLLSQKTAKVGDWTYDLKTKKSYNSDEVEKMFGIEKLKDDIFIDYLKEVIHKDDSKRVMKAFKDTLETGKDYQQIYRIYQPNNELRWISSKGILEKEKGYVKGVSQDITELKELELEKKQKDDILYQQSKMAAMGEMIGNIAHQWRQPLSTISTAATGTKIQKEMNILTDEQLCSSLIIINDSAQYLSQVIEDFREFFNPSNNKTNKFDISDIFSKTLKLVSAQFTAKDIEIIQNIESCKILSIENEMIQVLVNILNNARDALVLNNKGRRLLFINTYKKENSLIIEIFDNGKGIKEDIIDRIFEPYFTTKQESKGTGIGLYMSHDIVRNHLNGSLLASNKKFKYEDVDYIGAKFTIEISVN